MGIFSRLTGQKAKTESQAPAKTAQATAMRIKNILGIQQLETMPAQAARAFQLASDPKATLTDFVSVIESDEALSARIVRVANSVYFFRGAEATDIEKAVANIGLNELRCLISATMLRSLLKGRHKAREQIWANAVATAICCRNLSRNTDIGAGAAFLCGLLHDVGKLIMIRRAPELYDKVISRVAAGDKTFVEAEEEIFDTNHAEVGKWVAEIWNFPAAAIQAVYHHHDDWPKDRRQTGRGTSHAQLVKAADVIAHACGIGHPSHFRPFSRLAKESLPQAFSQLGMSLNDQDSFLANFEKQFNEEYGLYQLEKTT